MNDNNIYAAPVENYSPEARAFYDFWYGHMWKDEVSVPLNNLAYSTARYIWDAARRTPAVGEDGLPPLVEPAWWHHADDTGQDIFMNMGFGIAGETALYTAEQVRQAQRDAVASLRMSFDAAVSLAGETIEARNAEIADLRAQLARQTSLTQAAQQVAEAAQRRADRARRINQKEDT